MSRKPSKLVAVVVPLIPNQKLTADEKVSLNQLHRVLGRYDKFMIVSKDHKTQYDGFNMLRFSNRYFGSIRAHMRLLLSPVFYRAFRDYEYILIYHLDALAFSDQLEEWCRRGFDYIAPPWIDYPDAPYKKIGIAGQVGNGGFSLRKVSSFRNVIRVLRRPEFSRTYLRRILGRAKPVEMRGAQEDVFWGTKAKNYLPEFHVADERTALDFAFECNPQLCFEKTGGKLPFGCHAWTKHDRAFWETHLPPE